MMTKSLKKCTPMLASEEQVESNDDLLMAIFVRLLPKPIFKFKCVSKRWKNMLNDSYFHKSYSIRRRNEQVVGNRSGRLLAFFQEKSRFRGPGPHQHFNMLSIPQPEKYIMKELPYVNSKFIHCGDGLILFQKTNSEYFVANPVNRTKVKLPPPNLDKLDNLGIVCQENKVKHMPSFRVVGTAKNYNMGPNTILIDTYSSETGKWKVSKLVCTEDLNTAKWWTHPFVYNGLFHWFTYISHVGWCLLVYDSKANESCVQFVKLPLEFRCYCHVAITRSPGDDVLWLGMSNNKRIMFWRLPKDDNGSYKRKTTVTEDEWILMYTVDKESLSKEIMLLLESKNRKKVACDEAFAAESSLGLEALIPWNPLVAVLSMQQNVFLYNVETKSTEFVKYRGRSLGGRPSPDWFPFVESPYLSTYAPFERVQD